MMVLNFFCFFSTSAAAPCPLPIRSLDLSSGAPPAPVTTVVGRLFYFFLFFNFSLHSLLDGGVWFQTVEFGSVLECDWKMRFIVPRNHPERKWTSILVY